MASKTYDEVPDKENPNEIRIQNPTACRPVVWDLLHWCQKWDVLILMGIPRSYPCISSLQEIWLQSVVEPNLFFKFLLLEMLT